MKLHNLLFGLLIFSFFVFGNMFIIADLNQNYDLDMDTSEFNNTYVVIEDVYNVSVEMKTETLDAELEAGEQTWERMTKAPFKAVRMLRQTYRLFGAVINDVIVGIGVPPFVFQFFITALTLFIVFGLIYLIMRYKP